MSIIPVSELGRRMPEAGRIRLGVKEAGSRYPKKLSTLRFTSSNEELIRDIATLYGGDPRPWSPSKGRDEWEVITTVKEIPVRLGPDPLGGTPIYELWSGGGIVRRCDGVEATVSQQTPNGAEPALVPCMCTQQRACATKTRLSVILADIRFAGTWRLETGSEYAARELPGMVDAIHAMQAAGFGAATLYTRPETQIKNGQTRHFIVPALRTEYTPAEIADGQAHLAALAVSAPHVERLALPSAPLLGVGDPDDEVVEATIVDEEPPPESTSWKRVVIRCKEMGLDDDARHGFCYVVSDGRTASSKDLTPDEIERVMAVLRRIERGEVEFTGVVDGRAVIKRKVPTT